MTSWKQLNLPTGEVTEIKKRYKRVIIFKQEAHTDKQKNKRKRNPNPSLLED